MANGLTRTPGPPPRRRNRSGPPPGSRLAFTGWRRVQLRLLTALWLIIVVYFWIWWLRLLGDDVTWWTVGFVLLPLGYMTTVLPSFYWFFVSRARVPDHRPAPPGLRVAIITPCVPSSESIEVIEGQMAALAALTYPCDTWILDEQDVPEVRAVAERHGVRHFTRKDVPEWNEPGPPFQAKTKAGNVNAWIDHVLRSGLEYDVFVQFDIDHRPVPSYGTTLSWRAIVLEAARWPIVQWAVLNVLLRIKRPYMITPKGANAEALAPALRLYFPYFLMAWIGIGAIAYYVFSDGPLQSAGYLWLAILNVIAMLNVIFVATALEIRERFGSGQVLHVMRKRIGTVALLIASNGALAICISAGTELLSLTLT